MLLEAATLKQRAQALLRDLNGLLTDKGLSKDVTEQLQTVRGALRKKWADLLDAPAGDGEPAAATEAARLWLEAADVLRQDDSLDAQRGNLHQALVAWGLAQAAAEGEQPDWDDYPCIADVFPDAVVFRYDGDLWRADYSVDADDKITLGDPVRVDVAYVPEEPGEAPMDEAMASGDTPSMQNDPNVGGGTDRKKIPASSFAGKNRSFPIVTPQDVADAAQSIGRAGPDNYSTDQLKANIIRIAKAKGAAFVAKLPQAWQDAKAKEAAQPPLIGDDGAALDETAELLTGDVIPLVEAGSTADTVRVKLISPGWGSSGFYSSAVLRKAAPFFEGAPAFLDHPTAEEDAARPEGSVKNLIGRYRGVRFDEAGTDGPGVYGDLPLATWCRDFVLGLRPHVGTSIRAYGVAETGEAEGRRGAIIKEIRAAKSCDVVTTAGRGGRILDLYEAARGGRPPEGEPPTERSPGVDNLLTEAEAKNLREAMAAVESERDAAIARQRELQHELQMREAVGALQQQISQYQLHPLTAAKLATDLQPRVPFTGDKVDTTALETLVKEAVKAEVQYIAATSGVGGGAIRGMGGSANEDQEQTAADQRLEESFTRLLGPELAKTAAAGR